MIGGMPRWCYWVSAFFVLDTIQGLVFISRMVYGLWPGKTGDKITQTLNLMMIAASLTLFGVSYFRRRRGGFAVGTALALSAVGFLLLSTLWSFDPASTLRIAFVYLFVIIGVIGLARTMNADEFMHLLSRCSFACAIASIFLLFASHNNAVLMVPDGRRLDSEFVGIFPQKNVLGQVMAIGALATLHGIRVARYRVFGNLCMLLVFLGMTYASKSTGALMAALLFCGSQRIRQSMAKGRRGPDDRGHFRDFSYAVDHRSRGCARQVSCTDRQGSDLDRANLDMGLCHQGHMDEAMSGMGLLRFLATE